MTDSEWLTLKVKLLYESGLKLREIRRFVGGLSCQAIQKRLVLAGCVMRPPGRGPSSYPLWQVQLMQRVRYIGLSVHDTNYLLSLSKQTAFRYTRNLKGDFAELRGGKNNKFFKTPYAYFAWIEARNNILLAARADGATFKEISDLAGFEKEEISLVLLRRMGLPKVNLCHD